MRLQSNIFKFRSFLLHIYNFFYSMGQIKLSYLFSEFIVFKLSVI